jgi:hypothetical protein
MGRTLYDKALEKVREYEDKSSLNPTKRGKVFQLGEINKWNDHLAQVSLHIKLDTLLQHINAEDEEPQPEK